MLTVAVCYIVYINTASHDDLGTNKIGTLAVESICVNIMVSMYLKILKVREKDNANQADIHYKKKIDGGRWTESTLRLKIRRILR
jgi:hypothetical protein